MHPLVEHALQRADLQPQIIWDDPDARAKHRLARSLGVAPSHWPREVNSHVEAVHGHDEPGEGVGIHRPAPWRCRCQRDLALDYRDVPAAWAAHASGVTGLPVTVLRAHMLTSVAGQRAYATCSCSQTFLAPESDPTNGDAAVEGWTLHVVEEARR